MSLIKPFKGNHKVTQLFGNKLFINGVDIYAKYNLIGHNGLDHSLPIGTQLIAPIEGVVVEVDFDENGYGWYVKIENTAEGALIAHMSEVQVQVGFVVEQGQKIGLSGNTGNSTGPHVHLGYYRIPRNRQNGFNGYIDPTNYFLSIGGADMEIKDFNYWGIDPTNLESVQVVYNTWHDVANGMYETKEKYEELLKHDTEMTQQVNDAKRLIEEKFKLLTQIDDMGFKTIDDVKVVRDTWFEMDQAGFSSLQAIKNYTKALEDKITKLTEVIELSTGDSTKIIELQAELEKMRIKAAAIDPDSAWNKLASFLQLIVSKLRVKKVTASVDLDPVPVSQSTTVTSVFDAFNQIISK